MCPQAVTCVWVKKTDRTKEHCAACCYAHIHLATTSLTIRLARSWLTGVNELVNERTGLLVSFEVV